MPELINATLILKSGVANEFKCTTVQYEAALIKWKRYVEYHPNDSVAEIDTYDSLDQIEGTVSVVASQIAALSYEPVSLTKIESDMLDAEL